MDDQQLLRYSRHILLQDFDVQGQERVNAARALIVGAGGLGCPAAMYLAASGVGHIVIADGDVVELSNLQRQIAHSHADIGKAKVLSLAETLQQLNPTITVEAVPVRLTGEALSTHIKNADVVLDCSDNFTTRLAINRASVQHRVPLVSGAAIRDEGQVAVFNLHAHSPCYACLFGEQDAQENLTCSDSGVLSPLVGIIGAVQATEALKILAGYGEPLDGRGLLLDVHTMRWRTLHLSKDEACAVCGATNTTA
jgi:molybdopterin/thiamine biosynthesis adenylyltransferase